MKFVAPTNIKEVNLPLDSLARQEKLFTSPSKQKFLCTALNTTDGEKDAKTLKNTAQHISISAALRVLIFAKAI